MFSKEVSDGKTRIRIKGDARITATGWRGIVTAELGDEHLEKRGPPQTSRERAERDVKLLLAELDRRIMALLDDNPVRILYTEGLIDE